MKPIQVVLDEPLLRELDKFAKQRKVTRSAFLRTALAEALERLRVAEQVEQVRVAYARRPQTREERQAAAGLARSQASGARRHGSDW